MFSMQRIWGDRAGEQPSGCRHPATARAASALLLLQQLPARGGGQEIIQEIVHSLVKNAHVGRNLTARGKCVLPPLVGGEGRRLLPAGRVALTITPFTHPKRTGSSAGALPGSPFPSSGPASGSPLLRCGSDAGVRRRPGSGCGDTGRAGEDRRVRRQAAVPGAALWLSAPLETAGYPRASPGAVPGTCPSAQHPLRHQEAGDEVPPHRDPQGPVASRGMPETPVAGPNPTLP